MNDTYPHSGTDCPQNCCLCRRSFYGFGNNAEPVAAGRCCDSCNELRVIPARLLLLAGKKYEVQTKN